ncbi:helix-turn-helix domain-containing protein [Capillimicrobium parvum]|uniref:HTH cro/C1-type domain-containing protein n=1 Tax=Capillimicrobium parvum TaxID=2884022 RepID=A0A9E6XWV5_9ACTN|nr:helix-turn-helix transcriptional regulator [Capillimicrobium parvum]UGS35620.1 hypothetical protein DSM104329_02014 [Capillimicrobium parvum]
MKQTVVVIQDSIGERIRARREQLGLSMRAVARAAGVSPSYLGSIESGRNPATGRAPLPSVRVLVRLADALELELDGLLAAVGVGAPPAGAAHTLLYVMAPRPLNVVEHLVRLHGDTTERWILIPDPREPAPSAADDRVLLRCSWPVGADPYPDRMLDPQRVVNALDRELRAAAARAGSARVGLAIADCSAVMRWVTNPETEIAFESRWVEDVERGFAATLGRSPTANVCVYHHDDIEALALQVDPLGIGLALLRAHTTIAVVDRTGRLRAGAPAAELMLTALKPAGVSTETWADLCAAASVGLVARPA